MERVGGETVVVDDTLKRRWIQGTEQAVGGVEFQEVAEKRDRNIVRILNVKAANGER
jgi:hypothetical protein